MVLSVLLLVVAYLLGSVSFAVLVCRFLDLPDPRTYGSHNPGATNVLRSGKKMAAVLTLLGDCLKGVLAVGLVRWLLPEQDKNAWIAACAIAVMLGHLWPIFFRFQGGKGVATALGAVMVLNPWLGLAVIGVWLAMALTVKISSLSAITAAIATPFLAYWIDGRDEIVIACVILSILLIWRHQANIRKLLAGKESVIGR